MLPPALQHVLDLVVEELLTNTLRHGKPYQDAPIEVRLAYHEPATFLTYHDGGTAFDPRHDLPLDVRELSLEERPIGGLGWPLILH